jgi:hypothetical protein
MLDIFLKKICVLSFSPSRASLSEKGSDYFVKPHAFEHFPDEEVAITSCRPRRVWCRCDGRFGR